MDEQANMHAWPNDVLRPPGLVGEVYDWILETAPQPQPKFATAAALTACGALVGRGVRDYTGQRTNIFSLCVVPSSGGKQHPFACAQKLICDLNRTRLLAGEVTSDAALETLLKDFPSRLLFLDEVGDYLGSLKSAGQANPHLRTVLPRLKSLWSSAGGVYIGKTRAPDTNGKWRPPCRLQEPHLAIYGTGAPSRLFECLSERDLDDGSLPRFLTFISEEMPLREEKPEAVVPLELRAKLNVALSELGVKPHSADGKTDFTPPRLIEEDDDAKLMFESFEQLKHARMVAAAEDPPLFLWGKAVENARRVALTVASLRNPTAPVVGEVDAKYAVLLVTYAVDELVAYARENVAATEKERDLKHIERIIRSAGPSGISQSQLTRKTQSMKSSNRIDALQDLVDGESILREDRQGIGMKKVRWYYHGDFCR